MPLEPGQVIDQYRLDQTIHRGDAAVSLHGNGCRARTQGRLQGSRRPLRHRRRDPPALRQRGTGRRLGFDGHPHIVTVYKWGGSTECTRHRVDRRDQPGGAPRTATGRPAVAAQRSTRVAHADRRCPRLRSQTRGDPPRRQAGQRDGQDDQHAAHGVPRRLRYHEDGRRRDGATRDVPRHAGLRLSRADLRSPSARPSVRRLLARLHGVRGADRAATVR